ncbi:hypothetical protein HYPSUDRAFT_41014 [Hypholoma sublateritium FD-334 SS-4]|uniref:DUF6699 domain-containing protein n=1 Tax=Hypholoma sublateritium (strain FD-334 SS-4) TaxID=945553 RepID=A0A0D2MFL6_HYPSF|nr:hypothetical protein HYPSUDRAFT_41014 [Hypholoma sublateritium FD-334 SS-4]
MVGTDLNSSLVVPTAQTAQPHNFCNQGMDYCMCDNNCPPPLIPAPPTPLPPLANVPISVHPLLAHHRLSPAIRYDLEAPPSSASLALVLAERVSRQYWGNQPAMNPAIIGSITIRIAGLERPIVVFPARLDQGVVTVDDVLSRVHEAIHSTAVGGDGWDFGTATSTVGGFSWDGHWGTSAHAKIVSGGWMTGIIRRGFHSQIWWGGLAPSTTEMDVWVLHVNITNPSDSRNVLGIRMGKRR